MKVKEVLKIRKYKAGYEVREEVVDDSEYGGTGFTMKSAYSPSGDYIGRSKDAFFLCKKRGIAPEKTDSSHSVCSIGFCEKEQKWYGWSHRALYGFGIGSICKLGDCGYLPSNNEEFLDSLKSWYSDEMYKSLALTPKEGGVHIYYEIHQKKTDKIFKTDDFDSYPDKWGRGHWTANTLEEAKQMAIDFASGVS